MTDEDAKENAPDEAGGEYTAETGEDGDFSADAEGYDPFKTIRELIERSELEKAQDLLKAFNERNAEWYFVQASLFRKKNWFQESRRCLEHAIDMDPENEAYRAELDDLDRMASEGKKARENKKKTKKQMGGDGTSSCMDSCCEACALGGCECLCESMCTAICEGCS